MLTFPERFARGMITQNQDACARLDRLYAIRDQIETDGEWPAWCAMPMSEVMACLCAQHHADGLTPFIVEQTAPLTAAYLWQKTKQVFRFDPTLRAELEEQTFTGDLPGDALLRLPVPCVYVEGMVDLFGADIADGFFAWMEADLKNNWKELRILTVTEKDHSFASLMLPIRGTIAQSLEALKASAALNMQSSLGQEIAEKVKELPVLMDENIRFYSRVLNLLLYLCAEEPDYDKPPRRAKAKPAATLSAERPPRAASVTTAGVRIGAVIRKGYADAKTRGETEGSHTPKAPHVRRAHWHHYWTGARDSAERALVLKWIPPVFVGGSAADIVTVHPVRGGKTQQ